MVVVDGENGLIKMTNDLCLEMFGYEADELLGQPIGTLMPPEYRERHQKHFKAYLDAPRMRPMGTGHLFYGYRKNGEVFALDIGLNPLQNVKGMLVISSLLDVTQHEVLGKKMLHQIQTLRDEIASLQKLASEDELTKVSNRRTLMKQLQLFVYEAYESKRPLSVAMIDIDNFKEINDQHGHLAGDTLLRQFADEVRKVLRSKDNLARYGGDEFTVLLPETTDKQAFNILERLRSHLESLPWEIPVRASIGYSVYLPDQKEVPTEMLATELLLEADIALYHAKQSGRNKVVVYESGVGSIQSSDKSS
jgi:diguanylate cyclase (GGDEF)-like protein/PAS domain S-box-containing protein